MKKYDIAVIGGGASGMAAAIAAKQKNNSLNIVILERLSRVGKKILATGNGRCNLTNRSIKAENYYGSCAPKLFGLCEKYPAEELFRTLGVKCYADECGRVYPNSNSAASVLDALRLKIQAENIEIICEFEVSDIIKKDCFEIRSSGNTILSKRIIIAGGGMSQKALGSDGSVLRICRSLGMKTAPLYPALTSVKTEPELVKALKGQRVEAKASAYIGGKEAAYEFGEVQFGDGTISGICVFNLTCLKAVENAEIRLDILPDMSFGEFLSLLAEIRSIRSAAPIEDFLSGVFSKRIGMYITKKCTDKLLTEATSSLTDSELKKIASAAKSLCFPIKGVSGFEKSQVTGGGVTASEITDRLESVKLNGAYLCGEILDIIGCCGGYNLAFAFASGTYAGINCAEGLD